MALIGNHTKLAPAVDPAQGDPAGAWLRAAAGHGDWPAIRDFLDGARHPDDHAFYVDLATSVPGTEECYGRVVRAEPHGTLPLLLYGMRAIDWAWEARSALRAQYVSRERFDVFLGRLGVAEEFLNDVVTREPGNVTAWYGLMVVSRGRELGVEETDRRFRQVLARHPAHVRAHQQMLQQWCRKWGGSHEAMHAFAREAMLHAPAGSPLGHLVAIAHLEHWMDLDHPDGDAYIQQPYVVEALHEAADRSVCHPHSRPRAGATVQHNAFAMAFSLAGDRRAAARHFRAVGDVVTEFPWSYLDGADPAGAFAYHRTLAGAD